MSDSIQPTVFDRLVREHHAEVYRTAVRITRDATSAEDVAQQVFLRVLERKLDLGSAESPAKMLCWAATKLALNELRGQRTRRRHERRTQETESMRPANEEILRRDEQRAVRHAIDDLPDELRLPLVMRFESGLTFVAVGDALACSESTAHDRVRRGLAALRSRLERLGFAGLAARLPDALGSLDPLPVPVSLEPSLLRLGVANAQGLAAALPWKALVIAAVACAGVAVAWIASAPSGGPAAGSGVGFAVEAGADLDSDSDEERRSDVEPGLGEEGERTAVAVEPSSGGLVSAQEPIEPAGFVRGVVGDADGRPLAGVDVRAESVERAGKDSRFRVRTETDGTGRYELSVPIVHDGGQDYVVLATARDFEAGRSAPVLVRADETIWVDALRLARWAEDRPGEYALDVAVVDGQGRPIAGAIVRIYRRSKRQDLTFPNQREAIVETGVDGRAIVRGATLGEKRLEVRASTAGFRPSRTEFAIEAPGAHARVVTLEPGLTIEGRARTLDGEPLGGLCLDVVTEIGADLRNSFRTEGDGTFSVRGLEDREYVLMARDSRYSPFTRTVHAGVSGFDVVVKRHDDTRPGALHDGELHGVVRDAATGETIAVDAMTVLARPVWPDERATEADVLLEAWKPWLVQFHVGPDRETCERFAETGLDAGTWILFTDVPGYAPTYAGPFRLEGHELEDGIVLEVRRGAELAGRVVDAGGDPVPGAWVGLFPDQSFTTSADDLRTLEQTVAEQGFDWVRHCAHSVRTDADGHYRFEALPGGLRFRLAAVHEAWKATAGDRLELRDGERRTATELRFGVRR